MEGKQNLGDYKDRQLVLERAEYIAKKVLGIKLGQT